MNTILAIPLNFRLALLFALGVCVGAFINRCVYRLAWNQRAISPWSAPPGVTKRKVSDRLPVIGWWGLRREARLHGTGFWIRPLLVELLTGGVFAGFYWLELQPSRLLWQMAGINVPPAAPFLSTDLTLIAHWQALAHVLLVCLMLTASLIDFDEKTIPDSITIPGTLLGLLLAAAAPWSLLPAGYFLSGSNAAIEFLTLASPNFWPAELNSASGLAGPAIALGCWTLWCVGLLPRMWRGRRGLKLAVRILLHRLRRESLTFLIALLWMVGAAAIALAAWRLGEARWAALLTSLVGMAAGGGVIWGVRIIGSAVLRREAMGFGDVTLMAMIGAFLGWQACLVVFFLAPFFGLALAVINRTLRDEAEIPYGPFLCLAALAVVLKWPACWDRTYDLFSLGWLVPALMVTCLILLAVLLSIYQWILNRLAPRR